MGDLQDLLLTPPDNGISFINSVCPRRAHFNRFAGFFGLSFEKDPVSSGVAKNRRAEDERFLINLKLRSELETTYGVFVSRPAAWWSTFFLRTV